jgi:tetratricopeptide (TPR) repeat protein
MAVIGMMEPTPLAGIRYVTPPEGTVLSARDGRATVACGGLPIPLREDDAVALSPDAIPSYDAVGEGIYQALRLNPGCVFADRYATLLRDAYPHLVADLASQLLMLERKDVEVPYLDRLITALRIFLLMEPENPRFLKQIGRIYREKGLRLSALNQTTRNLYQAHSYLNRARIFLPDEPDLLLLLGDVAWLLGKYDEALNSFQRARSGGVGERTMELEERLARLESGSHPLVPAVDYLEAIGVAFELHQRQEYAEAAAILWDVLDDEIFRKECPLPELNYLLGRCYEALAMPRYAEECYAEALVKRPEYEEAQEALRELRGAK